MAELPLSHSACDGFVRRGRVTAVSAASLSVSIPALCQGCIVSVERGDGTLVHAEVRRVDEGIAACTPLGSVQNVVVGAPATTTKLELGAYVGAPLLGCVVDAWGRIPDASVAGTVVRNREIKLDERRAITRPLTTGVAAIDAFCTIGAGQRVGLFAGAGVGKSMLLRQMAQRVSCDVHVVALIGERAREARECIEGLRSGDCWPVTTVICATAAATPVERLAAVRTAQAQAEWLCALGCNVLLTLDSLTRVANAWRELALAAGEPAAHRGHPASMAGLLAAIVEKAGAREHGSITGIYAVLVDADDPLEPVSDALRGLLDGHIMLSRRLADAGRFPAIDVLRSSSRLFTALTARQHQKDAALVRRALATLEDSSDLLAVGAYRRGADHWLDAVLEVRDDINGWLFCNEQEVTLAADALALIAGKLRSVHGQHTVGA